MNLATSDMSGENNPVPLRGKIALFYDSLSIDTKAIIPSALSDNLSGATALFEVFGVFLHCMKLLSVFRKVKVYQLFALDIRYVIFFGVIIKTVIVFIYFYCLSVFKFRNSFSTSSLSHLAHSQ